MAYDAFAAEHGRSHSSHQEYAYRLGVYLDNVELIDQWNLEAASGNGPHRHTLAVNKFADWTEVPPRPPAHPSIYPLTILPSSCIIPGTKNAS